MISAAYLGISPDFITPTARICAWCPDRAAAELMAASSGMDCTHTICARCADALGAALESESLLAHGMNDQKTANSGGKVICAGALETKKHE